MGLPARIFGFNGLMVWYCNAQPFRLHICHDAPSIKINVFCEDYECNDLFLWVINDAISTAEVI
jgi:hypothetical protein